MAGAGYGGSRAYLNGWITPGGREAQSASHCAAAVSTKGREVSSTQLTDLKQFSGLLDAAAEKLQVGGHRGMGANAWHPTSSTPIPAAFRENTLKSFQRAVDCGASFLEFDVQVCADGVPVIWHDNFVVYGEAAAPTSRLISDMTSAEFHRLAPIIAAAAAAAADDDDEFSSLAGDDTPLGSSPCGSTISLASMGSAISALSGLSRGSGSSGRLLRKHDNDAPALPNEPTLCHWQCEQEDHFPTLADVFAGIPPHVAFDIEIKMAMPADLAVTPAEEVDRMVGATLAVVEAGLAAYGPRPIMFSSFDPEVCLEVKRRWRDAPVMFLSGGGVYAHADPRRTSIAGAVQFAAGAELQGIILHTLALQEELHMVEAARNRGLRMMTYGPCNNDPQFVLRQRSLGVHGVIVDDVAGVAAAVLAAPLN